MSISTTYYKGLAIELREPLIDTDGRLWEPESHWIVTGDSIGIPFVRLDEAHAWIEVAAFLSVFKFLTGRYVSQKERTSIRCHSRALRNCQGNNHDLT